MRKLLVCKDISVVVVWVLMAAHELGVPVSKVVIAERSTDKVHTHFNYFVTFASTCKGLMLVLSN